MAVCASPIPHPSALKTPCDRFLRFGRLWNAARVAWWPRLRKRLCTAAIQDRGSLPPLQNNSSFVDGALGGAQTLRDDGNKGYFDFIFLGTGTSEGVPRVSCLTNRYKRCPVCFAAAEDGNKNRRRNTSIIIRYPKPDGKRMNILIDAGKFFYHSALQWFPPYGIRQLDAVIITHSHADAIGGLDDLRDWTNNVQDSIPIYVAQRDLEVMQKTHYYLVDPSVVMEGTAVSKLQFKVINEEPFFVNNLRVLPLPVWHGPGYRSLGFRIGGLCYISDALDAVRRVRPKRALLTGMMHTMDHDRMNRQLSELRHSEGLDVQLSFDGMRVQMQL